MRTEHGSIAHMIEHQCNATASPRTLVSHYLLHQTNLLHLEDDVKPTTQPRGMAVNAAGYDTDGPVLRIARSWTHSQFRHLDADSQRAIFGNSFDPSCRSSNAMPTHAADAGFSRREDVMKRVMSMGKMRRETPIDMGEKARPFPGG